MAANDFVTRASIWLLTDSGYQACIVSYQNNRLIVRYGQHNHEKLLNENIRDLFSYNAWRFVMIFALLENQFQIFEFDVEKNKIILLETFNQHFETAALVSIPIIKLDKRYYNVVEKQFVYFKHEYSAVALPFAITSYQQTYLFKNDNIIKVFPKSVFSAVQNINNHYQLFIVQNICNEYRSYSGGLMSQSYYMVKAFGIFEFHLNLSDVGEAVPEYLRVTHVIFKQESVIYQINVCFVVSEKCRLFSRYIMENSTVKRHYFELHTNVRISRVFSCLSYQNIFTVSHYMFVVTGLRQCQRIIALKDRIDNIVFADDNYVVLSGDTCSLINQKGYTLCTGIDFRGSKEAFYFKYSLFVLFEQEIWMYSKYLTRISSIPAANCCYFVISDAGVFTFCYENKFLRVFHQKWDDPTSKREVLQLPGGDDDAFQYYAAMELLIVVRRPYSIIMYIPTLLQRIYSETALEDKLYTLNENGKLCAIQRTKFGNNYRFLTYHESKVFTQQKLFLLLRIVPVFQESVDVQSQYAQLYDAYSITEEFVHFLALSQFTFVAVQTKFNRADFPEWMYQYYTRFNVAERIPAVSSAELLNSDILYVAPVYHLEQIFFKTAQLEYQRTRDPNDAALFFILSGKTQILANLYKIKQQDKISDFLHRDFADEKNRQAAVKNAFILVSQHKYEMAIAWFILGGDYFNAVKIAFLQEYLNFPMLALRIFELFSCNGAISTGMIRQFIEWFDSSLAVQRTSARHFIDLFMADQLLKRGILKKEVNFSRIAEKLLLLLKQDIAVDDIDRIVLFLISANLYYYNMLAAHAILQIIVTLLIYFESPILRICYKQMAGWLKIKPNDILMNNIKNYRKLNTIQPQEITLDKIYEQNGLNFQKIAKHKKIAAIMLYLYVSQPQFKNQENQQYIMYYLLRNYRCQIYAYQQRTKLTIKQLVVLSLIFSLQIQQQTQNQYIADPLQQIAEVYTKIMTDSPTTATVGSFSELVGYIQDTWLPKVENLYFYNLLQNADPDDQKLLRLVLEEATLFQKTQLKNEVVSSAASQYIQQHSIESRVNVFNMQQLKAKTVQALKLFSISPLLILIFSEGTLYVFDFAQHSGSFECLQIISCLAFFTTKSTLYIHISGQIATYAFDVSTRAFIKAHRERSETARSFSSQSTQKFEEKPPYCLVVGSVVRFEPSGYYFVVLSSEYAQITFLQHDNDNTYATSFRFGKIIDFVICNLRVFVILEENRRNLIYSFPISDILCKRIVPKLLTSGYPKATTIISYTATEGGRFALLQYGFLISVNTKFDRYFFSVPLGLITSHFVLNSRNFCCIELAFCTLGKEKRNICLNCGQVHNASKDTLSLGSEDRVDIFWSDYK